MNKLIIVAFHLGRVGSSALMGLLKLSGINVGSEKHLIGPAPMNPKGFFELKSQKTFLNDAYKGIYPDITLPPPLNVLDKIGERYYLQYNELIEKEFENHFPIALKSQRFLTLPFLFRLRNQYDIKLIIMNRKFENQVNSTFRVWQKNGNSLQKQASKSYISEYINAWKAFSIEVERYYGFSSLHVSFEELISNPVPVSKAIFNFIKEQQPTSDQITSWLDPSLVNRSAIT